MTARIVASLLLLTGAACNCDGEPPPPPVARHVFLTLQPQSGDVLAGLVTVRVLPVEAALERVTVESGGAQLGELSAASGWLLRFSAAELAAGSTSLVLQGFAGGAAVERQEVPVVAIPSPLNADLIGPAGGALRTNSGVVVIVPPNAVQTMVDLMVADRPLSELPPAVAAAEIEALQAIDFLPASGVPDPTFWLERPARVQYPRLTMGLSSTAALGVFAVRDGAEVELVGAAENQGPAYSTPEPVPPRILAIRNLSAPDQPLHPLDLVEVDAAALPPVRFDLRIVVGGAEGARPIVGSSGTRARFLVPPAAAVGETQLVLVDGFSGLSDAAAIVVAPRPEPPPTLEEADRRITLLHARLDRTFADLEAMDWSNVQERRARNAGALLQALRSGLGDPVTDYRRRALRLRDALLSASAEERVQVGALLATLEGNEALLRGQGQGLETLTKIYCAVVFYGGLYLSYLGFVTPIWTEPADPLQDFLAGEGGEALMDAVINSTLCFPPRDPRPWGISHYECDILAVLRGENRTAAIESTVLIMQRGRPDPSEPGDEGPPVLRFPERTGDIDAPPPPGEVGPPLMPWRTPGLPWFGISGLRFVEADQNYRPVLNILGVDSMPTGTLRSPEPGQLDYLPVFGVRPPGEEVEDFFDFVVGPAAGLPARASFTELLAGDLDGDGDLDVLELGDFDVGPSGFYLRSLLRSQGDGTFAAEDVPLSDAPIIPGDATLVDLDQDGDLDVVGLSAFESLPALRAADGFENAGATGFVPRVWASDDNEECGAFSALAAGDFVGGGGVDLLVVTAYSEDAIGQPISAKLCLFVNDGSGTFTLRTTPLAGYGFFDRTAGAGVDLDRDGRLDAFFPRLGLVLFGDGQGRFTTAGLPATCYDRLESSKLRVGPESRPLLLDHDRDGLLDLLLDESLTPAGTAGCVLRQGAARTFEALALPAISRVPQELAGPVYAVADVDNDGWSDVVHAYADTLGVLLRRNGSYAARTPLGQRTPGILNVIAPLDADLDGRADLYLGTGSFDPDVLALGRYARAGAALRVRARSAAGAPAGPAAILEIDLGGDGDFAAAGGLVVRPAALGWTPLGVGAASAVDVRATFVDVGPAGGNQVVQRGVAAGAAIVLDDPQ